MHRVWRGNGFWQAALMEGVAAQMDLMDPGAFHIPVAARSPI